VSSHLQFSFFLFAQCYAVYALATRCSPIGRNAIFFVRQLHLHIRVNIAVKADNGSMGHGSNGLPKLDGSHGSCVSGVDPLIHKYFSFCSYSYI
jgi:hypothetical protein